MRTAMLIRHLSSGFVRWCRSHRGQSLVEFALLLPAFFALTVCVIDVGRGVVAYNLTSEAARSAARVGRIDPAQTAVTNAAKEELGAVIPNPTVTVNQVSSGGEPYVEVTISSEFTPFTLQVVGLTNQPIHISATSRQYMYNVVAAGGTPLPTMTPNATAFAEATGTARADLTATAAAAGAAATVLAGGPTPNATSTVQAQATQTAIAASLTAVAASQTAVVANATATALAALPPSYTLPQIPVVVVSETSTIASNVACGANGTLTSTIIAWTSESNSTGLRARLVPIAGGIPSAWQSIPNTGISLSYPVKAGVQYRMEVENTGNGSSNKDITIIRQPVVLSCPAAQ